MATNQKFVDRFLLVVLLGGALINSDKLMKLMNSFTGVNTTSNKQNYSKTQGGTSYTNGTERSF